MCLYYTSLIKRKTTIMCCSFATFKTYIQCVALSADWISSYWICQSLKISLKISHLKLEKNIWICTKLDTINEQDRLITQINKNKETILVFKKVKRKIPDTAILILFFLICTISFLQFHGSPSRSCYVILLSRWKHNLYRWQF